ncbi:MAG: hypothetical protein WDM85_05170 [Caulobacteraceae bacterium]
MGETALIDRLASISSRADAEAMLELRQMLAGDERLRVPPEVIAAGLAADAAALAKA